MNPLDSDYLKMSIVWDKPTNFFDKINFAKLNTCRIMVNQIISEAPSVKLKPVLWLNGTRYKAIMKPEAFDTSTYLALQLYRKDPINNLHHILAWLYRPTLAKHDADKAAKDFLNARMHHVNGTFFLFSLLCEKWKTDSNAYKMTQIQNLTAHLKEVARKMSPNFMDGFTPSKQ